MKYFREVNEDNVLIRNILGEFEDSLKYVSKSKCKTKNNQHRHTNVTKIFSWKKIHLNVIKLFKLLLLNTYILCSKNVNETAHIKTNSQSLHENTLAPNVL